MNFTPNLSQLLIFQKNDYAFFGEKYPKNSKYAVLTSKTRIPVSKEIFDIVSPTTKGKKAPPDIAIIIKPEISLLYSGFFSTAMLKIRGKIFAIPNPIRKISTQAVNSFGTKINTINVKIESHAEPIRNFLAEIFVKRIAPRKAPNILAKK